MFGYVKPFKPELKILEFDAYKSVYCGLCGQLGKAYGPAARLTLSYDFTFLAMLHFSLSDEGVQAKSRRCYVNPLKKIPCVKDSEALRFSADIAAIMLYYKLLDNIADSGALGKIGWSLPRPLASAAHKKAAAARPQAEEIIHESMARQAKVELEATASLDEAAEPTADAMARLFDLLPADENTRRILARFGYFLGRFSYICDALDDIESDLKRGCYNPLIQRFELNRDSDTAPAREAARESLYMTIGEAAKAYDLLMPREFKPILDNIAALGLRHSVDMVFERKKLK